MLNVGFRQTAAALACSVGTHHKVVAHRRVNICFAKFSIMGFFSLNQISFVLPLATLIFFSGCYKDPPVEFEENLVLAKKLELQTGMPMQQVIKDSKWALDALFGSPDKPALPKSFSENKDFETLISVDALKAASGPETKEGQGLFRQHCARCHGITGNGRGENATLVEPYPRDFRAGVFKFKSTSRSSKPIKSDLIRVIKHGIAGSSMVAEYQLPGGKVGPLPHDSIDQLADYVIYLSIRGEAERQMLEEAALELNLEDGERLIEPELAALSKEEFDEQWNLLLEIVDGVASEWAEAADDVVEIEVPSDLPVASSHEDLLHLLAQEDSSDTVKKSIARGKELFGGTVASCSKCHGIHGRGDGQEADYDDWTKDWTTRIGLNPVDEKSLVPLIARGALPPRTIKPRNFEEGIFRGGSNPEDLYRRLTQGIAGTPMPAVTFVEGQLDERDVWNLINYIHSLKKISVDPSNAGSNLKSSATPAMATRLSVDTL